MATLGLRGLAGALLAVTVVACQVPADPVSALAEQAGPVRRSDQFQAVAGNGTTLVVVGAFGAVLSSSDNGRDRRRHPFLPRRRLHRGQRPARGQRPRLPGQRGLAHWRSLAAAAR